MAEAFKPAPGGFRRDRAPQFIRRMWVSIRPIDSTEQDRDGIEGLARYEIRTPWFPGYLPGGTYLVLDDGRKFDLGGIVNDGEKSLEYVMQATETRTDVL